MINDDTTPKKEELGGYPIEAATLQHNNALFLRTALEAGPTAVSYLKKNGDLRNGVFTLNMDQIPEASRPKDAERPLCEAEQDGDLIRAYDTAAGAFRSINVDTLISFVLLSDIDVDYER